MSRAEHQEALTTFFTERLCGEADLVYRLGFALTLSRKEASQLVHGTFKTMIGDLVGLLDQSTAELRVRLCKTCFQHFKGMKGHMEGDASKIAKFFGTLAHEARAALVMVDFAGLTPAEAASALSIPEDKMRAYMAQARKGLLQFGEP